MVPHFYIFTILLSLFNVLRHGSVATSLNDEKLTMKRRLEVIGRHATKSFVTEHGDILDCVDINKQPVFDHPLLKSHSIQVQPTRTVGPLNGIDGRTSSSNFLPEHMRCPQGTVPILRVQKDDLALEKFTMLSTTTTTFLPASSISNSFNGHEIAGLGAHAINLGASGRISVWNPKVQPDQFSSTFVYVASGSGDLTNSVQAGWMVNPSLYPNSTETRLYGYWTKDSGKSTGCLNTICPGFVQVSKKAYLGLVITTISKPYHKHYFINIEIRQDIRTKNWWLYYEGEGVGYWPGDLFSTLKGGATGVGWGGETYNPSKEPSLEMGSGYLADWKTSYSTSCAMTNLGVLGPELFPSQDIKTYMTNSSTYNVLQGNDKSYWQNFIYFGGPHKA